MQREFHFDQRPEMNLEQFVTEIENWTAFGTETSVASYDGIPVYTNEFWTSRQRASHSLH